MGETHFECVALPGEEGHAEWSKVWMFMGLGQSPQARIFGGRSCVSQEVLQPWFGICIIVPIPPILI